MATPNYTALNTRQIGKTTIMFVLFETGNYGTIEKTESTIMYATGDNNSQRQKDFYHHHIKQLKKDYINEFAEQGGLDGIEEVYLLAEEICMEL